MDTLIEIGHLLLTLSSVSFAISLGGIVYQHIVEFPNWSDDMPTSLVDYRQFFKRSDFGDFFKIFMPISLVCLLIAIFLLWNKPTEANGWTLSAMAGLFLTAAFTNFYFVPKHEKLFINDITESDSAELAVLATQWRKANLIRIAVMTLTLVSYLKACYMTHP